MPKQNFKKSPQKESRLVHLTLFILPCLTIAYLRVIYTLTNIYVKLASLIDELHH
jgi:hypothetical protein